MTEEQRASLGIAVDITSAVIAARNGQPFRIAMTLVTLADEIARQACSPEECAFIARGFAEIAAGLDPDAVSASRLKQ
jgi:hypothetical protein